MWKNIVEPQLTVRRIYITCWMPKATNTYSEYVTLIAFPRQQCFARTHLNVTSHLRFAIYAGINKFHGSE